MLNKANEKLRNNSSSNKETGKILVSKAKNNDDSKENTQKDVIVRRIKKKNENSKVSSHTNIGFGHK